MSVGTALEVWGYGAESEYGFRACTPRRAHQVVVAAELCEAAGVAVVGKLCVRNTDTSHGVCGGDSGGPVFLVENGATWVIGVTSSGLGCECGSLGTVALLPAAPP
ncbi:trypsin-like serine protease [Micropruina sp.]|uniref:trypsin-like serine protease n=1 Tax=Micropruina sp. TaxID=2737536 RepID=UPI00344FE098